MNENIITHGKTLCIYSVTDWLLALTLFLSLCVCTPLPSSLPVVCRAVWYHNFNLHVWMQNTTNTRMQIFAEYSAQNHIAFCSVIGILIMTCCKSSDTYFQRKSNFLHFSLVQVTLNLYFAQHNRAHTDIQICREESKTFYFSLKFARPLRPLKAWLIIAAFKSDN